MAEGGFTLRSFKEQFDDQLTCNVCLDQYTNPKTLPCLHSFCLKCIQPLPIIIKVIIIIMPKSIIITKQTSYNKYCEANLSNYNFLKVIICSNINFYYIQ